MTDSQEDFERSCNNLYATLQSIAGDLSHSAALEASKAAKEQQAKESNKAVPIYSNGFRKTRLIER